MLSMQNTPSPMELAQQLEVFFSVHPSAVVLQDGMLLFDMRQAHYSVTGEHQRCMLHLWSEERNLVRTVTGIRVRSSSLQIEARRFGHTKPESLLILPAHDRRTPTARDAARRQYLQRLQRLTAKHFDGVPESFSTAMDMRRSLGPAFARGLLV